MGALRQYFFYWRIGHRGATDAWCRAGKERALLQIKATIREILEFAIAVACALAVAFSLYILTGGM